MRAVRAGSGNGHPSPSGFLGRVMTSSGEGQRPPLLTSESKAWACTPPSSPLVNVRGSLTPEESNYLRAYNQEMFQSGSGHYIDLAYQHGALSHHLIPFFVRLENPYRTPT